MITTKLFPNNFPSSFLLKLFLCLGVLLFSGAAFSQNGSDDKKLKDFEKKIKKVIDGKRNFKVENGDLSVDYNHEDNNVAYVISGNVSLFEIENVDLEAEVGVLDSYIKITANYPEDPRKEVKLDGQPVSDWLPALYSDKLQLTKQELTLFPSEKKIKDKYEIKTWYCQPGDKKYEFRNCILDSTQLLITLKKDKKETGPTPEKTLELTGDLIIGSTDFSIKGKNKFQKKIIGKDVCEWEIGASREEIIMNDLITAMEQYNDLSLSGIPDAVREVTLQEPKVNFNNDKALTISGITAIGKMEAMVTYAAASKNDFLLGYSPEEDYALSDINHNLRYLDGLELNNLALVYAFSAEKDKEISLGLLDSLGFGGEEVKPGAVVLGKYDMPDGIPLIEKVDTVTFRADVPSDPKASIALAAKIDLGLLDLGKLKISEAWVSLEPESKTTAIGMSVIGDIPELTEKTDVLDLSGETEFNKDEQSLDLLLEMEEDTYWETPFGFPGITIGNFGLEVGASGPDKKIGVTGDLTLGNLEASITGFLDSKELMKSMISVCSPEVDLESLLGDFFTTATLGYLDKFPAGILPVHLRNVEVTIIPSPMEVLGKLYDPGLRITGEGDILGLTGQLELFAAYDSGFEGTINLDPVFFPTDGARIFDLEGMANLDLTSKAITDPNHAFFDVKGNIDMFGFSRKAEIEVALNGFHFHTEGILFNTFDARVNARGNDFKRPEGMYVQVAMKADFLKYLDRYLQSGLALASKTKQEAIKGARSSYDFYNRNLNEALSKLPSAEEALTQAEKSESVLKDAVKEGEKLLRNAWDEVPDEACAEFWDVEVCIPIKVGKYVPKEVCGKVKLPKDGYQVWNWVDYYKCIDVDDYSYYKNLVDNANNVLKNAREELKPAEDFVIEVSGKLGKLKDNLVFYQEGFEIAKRELNNIENATDKLTRVARGMLEDPANIIQVHSANFEGNLKDLNGGVVQMKFSGSFLGAGFQVTLPYNFKNPQATVDALVKHLMGV